MSEKRPQILITNDDGYAAKGLRKLVTLMRTLGDVVLISTDEVMSAKSHSCSIRERIYVRLVHEEDGFIEYRCNGTPVDCVKLGYQKLMAQPPDLVVSGINHGMNAATTVVYSGTIGAVIEACMNGLNAIGYSLFSLDPDADFDHLDTAILEITKKVLKEGLPKGVCLNVNFPKRGEDPVKGIKVCRQAACRWVEYFKEQYDENGEQFYDLDGTFESDDIMPDTDLWALYNNFISVVPTCFDWTAHRNIEPMKEFEKINIDARLRDTRRETIDSPVSRSPVSRVK
ncbi:MAG: 5'/3'-nucleotidase SurE [Bacteroidales bacterium]|nr:5'/3'-nucleotidase SurE [Bacteroidales bacterium]